MSMNVEQKCTSLSNLSSILSALPKADEDKLIDEVFDLKSEQKKGTTPLVERNLRRLSTEFGALTTVAAFKNWLPSEMHHALSPKIASDSSMRHYISGVREKLLGADENDDKTMHKPLNVRALKQLISEMWTESDNVMYRQYCDESDVYKEFEGLRTDLATLCARVTDTTLKEKIARLLKAGQTTIKVLIDNSNHDESKLREVLDAYLKAMNDEGRALLNSALADVFGSEREKTMEAFDRKTGEILESFRQKWEATFAKDDDRFLPKDFEAAEKKMRDQIKGLTDEAGKTSPGATAQEMNRALEALSAKCKGIESQLEDLSVDLLGHAVETVATKRQNVQDYDARCERAAANMKKFVSKAVENLSATWQDRFGSDCAKELDKAQQALRELASGLDDLKREADAEKDPKPDETAEEHMQRLNESARNLEGKLKELGEKIKLEISRLVDAAVPNYKELIDTRKKKALADLALTNFKAFAESVTDALKRAPLSDAERDSLIAVLEDTRDELGTFAAPTEAESVEDVRTRYDKHVQALNEAYIRAAVDPAEAKKKAYEKAIRNATDNFLKKANEAVEGFRRELNNAFSNENAENANEDVKKLLDQSCEAYVKSFEAEIGRLVVQTELGVCTSEAGQEQDIESAFDKALDSFEKMVREKLDAAKNEVAEYPDAQRELDDARASFEAALGDIEKACKSEKFGPANQVVDAEGRPLSTGPKTKKYLMGRWTALKQASDDLQKTLRESGAISGGALKVTAKAFATFGAKVQEAYGKANGDPAKFMLLLQAIPTPVPVIKTVSRQITDEARIEAGGADGLDNKPGIVLENLKTAQENLGALKDLISSTYDDLPDERSKMEFQTLACSVLDDVCEALNDAVKAGQTEVLKEGITRLMREAWDKISLCRDRLENQWCQGRLAERVQDVLDKLKTAIGKPVKLNAIKCTVRLDRLSAAQTQVEMFARLAEEKLLQIQQEGGVPEKTAFGEILNRLERMENWVTGYDSNANRDVSSMPNLVKVEATAIEKAGGRMFDFTELEYVLDDNLLALFKPALRNNDFLGINETGPESLEKFRQGIQTKLVQQRDQALENILRQFDLDSDEDRQNVKKENTQREFYAKNKADAAVTEAGQRRGADGVPMKKDELNLDEVSVDEVRIKERPQGKRITAFEQRQAKAARQKAVMAAREKFVDENKAAFQEYERNLRVRLDRVFLNVPGMESYLVRDDVGNPNGWTLDGVQILDEVARKLKNEVAGRAFQEYFGDGTGLENKDMTARLAQYDDRDLVSVLADERRAYEQKHPLPGDRLPKDPAPDIPRGGNIFGLDVDKLTSGQKTGLMNILRAIDPKVTDKKFLQHRLPPFRPGKSVERASALKFEQAILSGALRLDEVSEGLAHLLVQGLQYTRYMGTDDIGVLLGIFRDCGFTKELPDGMADSDKANSAVKALGALLMLNGNETAGLEALSRRVFNKDVMSVVKTYVDAGDTMRTGIKGGSGKIVTPDAKALRKTISDILMRSQNDSWRAEFDPYARAGKAEQRVVLMLRMEYAYGSARRGQDDTRPAQLPDDVKKALASDQKDLADLRELLREVASAKGPLTAQKQIGGVRVTLKRDAKGIVTASVQIANTEIERIRNDYGITVGGVKQKSGFQEIPVDMPLKPDLMLEMLDDAVLANVAVFGTKAAAALFGSVRQQLGESFPTSSRVRQMCASFLKSYANVDAAKLCFLSTQRLTEIVDEMLGKKRGAYDALTSMAERRAQFEHDYLSHAAFDDSLNAKGTLEVYRKYVEACKNAPGDVDAKVTVPEPERVRKNETLSESRVRRLHEFASELIQPSDTTRFDLDCEEKIRPEAIMRRTLQSHPEELRELLAMNRQEILAFFSIKGDKGLRLDGFAAAIADLADGLRKIRDMGGSADMDALLGKLRDEDDVSTTKLFATAVTRLSDSSSDVLKNLQNAFSELFAHAFGKNPEILNTPIWQQTLDELSNTVTIDPNKGYGGFLKTVLGRYFAGMTETDRQRMTALTMRYAHADAPLGEVLGALLKGSGPILQKLMQGLPQSALPQQLQIAVEDLKSNLAPIATETVRAQLYDLVQESNGRITNITVLKSLGAASVGQAFLCRVTTQEHPEGEECVIKLLRPDVQNRARRESVFFESLVGNDIQMKIMLEERFARIFDELDLTIEGSNVAQGVRYDPNGDWYAPLRVRSMKTHPASRSTTNALFLRCAPGTTFDRYVADLRAERMRLKNSVIRKVNDDGRAVYEPKDGDPYALRNVANAAYRLYEDALNRQKDLAAFVTRWTEEVAFGSGFFHGDVHAGNIMTDKRGLTVIDYGNASQFTKDQQTKVKNMLAAAMLNRPDVFFSTFCTFLSKDGEKTAKVKAAKIKGDLADIFSKGGKAEVGKRFVAALQYLQNADVELPGALFNLIECMRRLDESLELVRREMDELRELTLGVMPRSETVKARYWFDGPLVDALNDGAERYDLETAKKQIAERINEACGKDRAAFEDMMKDVRSLVQRADVTTATDVRARLKTLVDSIGDVGRFLDPNREDGDMLRKHFADALAECIATLQSHVFGNSLLSKVGEAAYFRYAERGLSFTDAIGAACERHEAEIAKAMDKGMLIIAAGSTLKNKILSTKTPEEAHKERLESLMEILKQRDDKRFAGLTEDEVNLVMSFGKYFCLPRGFGEMVKETGWMEKKDKTTGKLGFVVASEVFSVTLGKLREKIEKRFASGDLITNSKTAEDSYRRCISLLAAFYKAQLEPCGFEQKQRGSSDIAKLCKDHNLSQDMKDFIFSVGKY